MLAIFVFLLAGAASTAILMRRKWAPKVNDIAPEVIAPAVKPQTI